MRSSACGQVRFRKRRLATALDDTIIWLRAIEKMIGAKRHTRLGILGPHYIQVEPSGLLEGPNFQGYDGLLRLHGPSRKKEGEVQ